MKADIATITGWLRQRMTASATSGFVVGLSGGLDSAVVLRLCQLASNGHVAGLIMPCGSDPQDESDARLVANHFSAPVVAVDLNATNDALLTQLRSVVEELPESLISTVRLGEGAASARVPLANIRPRLRMTSLYFVANLLNYLVAGAGNKSELMIGYFTKYGDGAADVLPIGHLLKSEVRELAKALNVPDSIIDKTPSAGLWVGQTDEAEMGFKYDDLEAYLNGGPEAVSPALALRLERTIRASEHKRSLPPTPESDVS
jgi:NAD+ synthase